MSETSSMRLYTIKYLPTKKQRNDYMRWLSPLSSPNAILFSEIPKKALDLYYDVMGHFNTDMHDNAVFVRMMLEEIDFREFHPRAGIISIVGTFRRIAYENIHRKQYGMEPLQFGDTYAIDHENWC